MKLDDLLTVLRSIPGVKKVISDGRLDVRQRGERNLLNVPYIEVVEEQVDLSEHTSDARKRGVAASARDITP